MPYIALKEFLVGPNDAMRTTEIGDLVPEAETWKDPGPWINGGHIKWVAEAPATKPAEDSTRPDMKASAMAAAVGEAEERKAAAPKAAKKKAAKKRLFK